MDILKPKNEKLKVTFDKVVETPLVSEKIDKLSPIDVEFLESTNYLNELKKKFIKLKINLNQDTNEICLNGSRREVDDANVKIKNELDSIKLYSYHLDVPEIARFLKKLQVKEKIYNFMVIALQKSFKEKQMSNNQKLVTFCKYDIETFTNKNGEVLNDIVITTNNSEANEILTRYISESIKANRSITVNKKAAQMIKYNDPMWSNLYDKVKDTVDYILVPDQTTNQSMNEKLYKSSSTEKWILKLTGFSEDIQNLKSQLININKK